MRRRLAIGIGLVTAVVTCHAASHAQTSNSTKQPADPARERAARKTFDLRPKFVAGRETRYTLRLNSTSDVTGPGLEKGDGEQVMSQEIGLLMRVTSVTDDGATVQLVYESLKLKLRSPIADVDFDSTRAATGGTGTPPNTGASIDPVADVLNTMLAQIPGTTLTMVVDSSGAIVSVTGGEALSLGASLGLPNLNVAGAGGGGLNWVGNPGSAGGVDLENRAVGETWSYRDALTGTPVGSFTMHTTHRFRSVAGSMAKLTFDGRVESPSQSTQPQPAAPAGAPGLSGAQEKDSRYEGSYQWDLRAGELAEMESSQHVVMEAATGGLDGLGLGGLGTGLGAPAPSPGTPQTYTMTSDVKVSIERQRPARTGRPPRR
jgi:hypothetical protein